MHIRAYNDITIIQQKEMGILIAGVLLIIDHVNASLQLSAYAIVCLLAALLLPVCFKPIAWCWLMVGEGLSFVVSHLLLSSLYFIIVTPVGVCRRLLSGEALQMEKWKRSKESVFLSRTKRYTKADLERMF